MAARLNPYIAFKGNAREAIEYYAEVLGGTPEIMTFGAMGEEGPLKDKVMHAFLETPDGFALMASDQPDEMPYTPGDNISVSLSGDDESLSGYWDRLAADGSVIMPFEKQMWGDTYGMVKDRFGIVWMVNLAGAPPGQG